MAAMPMKSGHRLTLRPPRARNDGEMRILADKGPVSDFDIRLTSQTAFNSDIARLSVRDLTRAQQSDESGYDRELGLLQNTHAFAYATAPSITCSWPYVRNPIPAPSRLG
ncbi:hypothetical protein Q7P35_001704 [Cladosporium inversicolor]